MTCIATIVAHIDGDVQKQQGMLSPLVCAKISHSPALN